MINRFYYRCLECLSVFATNERVSLRPIVPGAEAPKCDCLPEGGRLSYMGQVIERRLRKDEIHSVCDRRCTHAQGPQCNCMCRGANHGSGMVVVVSTDQGPVPRLKSSSPGTAAEYLEAKKGVIIAAGDYYDQARYPILVALGKASKMLVHKKRVAYLVDAAESLRKKVASLPVKAAA